MRDRDTSPMSHAVPRRTESNKENEMNTNTLSGNWKQLKGKAREQWGKLTDDQLDVINGRRDQLVGKVQEAYGKSREQAEREVDEFCERCRCN